MARLLRLMRVSGWSGASFAFHSLSVSSSTPSRLGQPAGFRSSAIGQVVAA